MKNKKLIFFVILLFPALFKIILEFTTINSRKLPHYGPKELVGKDTTFYKVSSDFKRLPALSSDTAELQNLKLDTINFPLYAVCFIKDSYKKDDYRMAGLTEYAQYKKDKIKLIPFVIITPFESTLDYKHYFAYNEIVDKESLKRLIISISKATKKSNPKISIISCSSKVPTSSFINNKELSEYRAIKMVNKIKNAVSEVGGDSSKINFIIYPLVEGPDYIGDYLDIKKYQPFQYVKVIINHLTSDTSDLREMEKLSVGNKNIYNYYWNSSSFDSLNVTYFKEKPIYVDYSFFVLVDKNRNIRGYYDGRYIAEIKRLTEEYQHLRIKEEKEGMVSANKIESK